MKFKNILFFGDLPPKYLTGTSISSSLVLNVLQDYFKIIVIEEDDNFKYQTVSYYLKFLNVLRKCITLFYTALSKKIDIFYLVFAASNFGCIKTSFCVLSVKIVSPRTKVILHIHRGDFFNKFFTKRLNRLLSRFVFQISDTVVLLSKSQLREFTNKFPGVEFRVLENSLDYEPNSVSAKPLFENSNRFIFISNYFKEKGILDLLECFKELVIEGYNVELDTFGMFSSNLLKNEVLKYNDKRIRIHNAISGEKKHDEIRKSSCLILPSWNEGQPLVILEAMANATPVIATSVGLIPEMLGKNYKYIFEPRDKDELKAKIINFIKANNKLTLGEALRDRYNQLYGRTAHKIKVLNAFKVYP